MARMTTRIIGATGGRPTALAELEGPKLDLPSRDTSRWSKVKDRSWYEREAWRFDRR
jgi:hypothetical protein